jgi:hypothetical protein
MDLLKEYDCEILYHTSKANIVADALSRLERPKPIQVKSYKQIETPDVMKQISDAQTEGLKDEHIKKEQMVGQAEKLIEYTYKQNQTLPNLAKKV